MREEMLSNEGRTDAPWPHAQGKKISFQVCADHSNFAFQTFQHSVLALYPDGSGSIDCPAGHQPRALAMASAALQAPYEQCILCRVAASLRHEELSQRALWILLLVLGS